MKIISVNGRRIEVPDAPLTPEQIASAGKISPGRRIIHRKREGNFPVNPGERIDAQEGDTFVDAPQRVKG